MSKSIFLMKIHEIDATKLAFHIFNTKIDI